jgi:hypothetical protein
MEVLIPISFYGYDTIIYLISAMIGFAISFYGYKIYKMTKEKPHFYLYSAFIVLSIGMLIVALTSAYSYSIYFQNNEFIVFDQVFGVEDLGMWIYFFTSLVGYSMLSMMYLSTKKEKLLIALPISFNYYAYFNLILIIPLAYVALRSTMNYFLKKSKSSFCVMSGFMLILMYHAMLPFTFLHKIVYVAAHGCLILGFLSLLYMVWQVNKK